MKLLKALTVALAVALPCLVQAQTSPNLTYGQVLTPAQWNAILAGKQDFLRPVERGCRLRVASLFAASIETDHHARGVKDGTPVHLYTGSAHTDNGVSFHFPHQRQQPFRVWLSIVVQGRDVGT